MTEAELIFSEIFNCDRLSLYLNKDSLLSKDKSVLLSSVLKRRILGEPIQYILGKTEFMGLEFKVDRNVLVPRPETEILVETVVKLAYSQQSVVHSLKILEIGTGSGCIAISLAKLLKDANIAATDISKKAIEIAKCNALLNNVVDKISFIHSNLFTSYELPVTSYDIIVSNPPYIPTGELRNLQPEIRYEPVIALDGGRDGLDYYRKISVQAPRYLKEDGFLITEIGFNQKNDIENIFQKDGDFQIIEVIKDYNSIDRVIVARKRKVQNAKRKTRT